MTLPRMSITEIRSVIDKWADVNVELGLSHAWVQVCVLCPVTKGRMDETKSY